MEITLQIQRNRIERDILDAEFTLTSLQERMMREESKERLNKYKDAEIDWYKDEVKKLTSEINELKNNLK